MIAAGEAPAYMDEGGRLGDMVDDTTILAALAGVPGPDGRIPLPQSGAISGLTIRDGKVFLAIRIDPQQAGPAEGMRAAAEAAIRGVKGVTSALVSLTADKPAPPKPAGAPVRSTAIPGVRHIIAVASGKGGVGKSTTAVNLALGLAASGWQVGLLDADIYGPSVPRLVGVNRRPDAEGRTLQPIEAFGLKVMSIGFLVEEETAMIWRGPMVMGAIQQLLREVAWGDLDCLVVDMPPGTGDAQLTLAQNVALAGAIIVSTPQDLALIDARRGIAMFAKVDVPVLGLIENMSYFLCPACGTRSDIFAHGGTRHEAERLGVPFLGEVPLHIDIRTASDAGKPIVASAPDGPHAAVYREIAGQVRAALERGTRRPAPKITMG